MDTPDTDDLWDASWLPDAMPDIPGPTPEEAAMVAALVGQAKATMAAKAQLRASRRKKEDPAAGPSEKISIRIPRPLLGLLREQAAQAGMPYQTFTKLMLHDLVLREAGLSHNGKN